MAYVIVVNVVAYPAGQVMIVRAQHRLTHACLQKMVKFVRAMANVFAVRASVRKQTKIGILENIARIAQHVQDQHRRLNEVFFIVLNRKQEMFKSNCF